MIHTGAVWTGAIHRGGFPSTQRGPGRRPAWTIPEKLDGEDSRRDGWVKKLIPKAKNQVEDLPSGKNHLADLTELFH